mgnify:CR=1 FL=1
MDFSEQLNSALVVEQQPLAQSHIKHTLQSLGFKHIDFADRAHLALQSLSSRNYELVLCAYDLNRGADGYQLFERIMDEGLLSSATTFVFLSSENDMPLSQSIIELKPDDFLLKPFTGKELELRLKRVLLKKIVLHDVFEAIDKQAFKKAISALNEHISTNRNPKWIPYLMKLKGEIIVSAQNWPLAEKFFAKVCQVNDYPWAKLGLIESLLHQQKLEEAKSMLKDMLETPQYRLQALDLMAQICKRDKNFDQALEHIKQASAIAPRNVNRQQQVASLARLTHDFELQYNASTSIVRHARHSIHDTPETYLSAVRAAIDYGVTCLNQDEVNQLALNSESILHSMRRHFPGIPLNEQIQVAQARILNMKNESDKAKKLIFENIDAKGIYYIDDLEDALDKAKAFHEMGFHTDSQRLFSQIATVCDKHDDALLFNEYIKNEQQLRVEIKQSPKQLNNQAVGFFSRGNYQGAYEAFRAAFRLMPRNISIALNLMQTIIEHKHLDLHAEEVQEQIKNCQRVLRENELSDEQRTRLSKLNQMLHERRVPL